MQLIRNPSCLFIQSHLVLTVKFCECFHYSLSKFLSRNVPGHCCRAGSVGVTVLQVLSNRSHSELL